MKKQIPLYKPLITYEEIKTLTIALKKIGFHQKVNLFQSLKTNLKTNLIIIIAL